MLGRDWFKRHSLKLISGTIVIILCLVAVSAIFYGVSEQVKYNRDAYNHSKEYATNTYTPERQGCFGLPAGRQHECVTVARNEARAYDRNEQDLVAQKTSAVWAFLMGSTAIVGIILSVVGVSLVWTTFNATREANAIAREAMVAQTRPWLKFTKVTLKKMKIDDTGVHVIVEFVVENVGHSPALRAIIHPKLAIDSRYVHVTSHVRRDPFVEGNPNFGVTVFSKDEWVYPIAFNIEIGEIQAARSEQTNIWARAMPNDTKFEPFPPTYHIIANAEYEFTGSSNVHITSTQFMVWKGNPSGPEGTGFMIPFQPGDVDMTDVVLLNAGEVRGD